MMRNKLILTCFTASLFVLGCSDNNGNKGNGSADLATGVGGNGGDDMATGGGGGGGTGGGDMASSLPDLSGLPPADHDPTKHTPEVTFTNYGTASPYTAPVIYTVVWTGETQTNGKDTGAVMQAFTDDMLKSDYWYTGVKEYGVGKGQAAPAVITLPDAVPTTLTDTQLQTIIKNNLGKAGWPKSTDKNALIQFIIDPKTTVSNGSAQGCKAFGGYHSNSGGALGGGIDYAVDVYCYLPGTTTPDFDNLTVAASHEAAEAMTDYNQRGNSAADGQSFPFLGGGEDGDLCLQLNSKQTWASGSYMVQRLFSNAVAMANNNDPCLPSDGAWFGAAFDSGNAAKPGELTVTLTGGAGEGTFKILPFAYDASVGPIAFYVPKSLVPAGVTFEPDFAAGTDPTTGMPAPGKPIYANPGSTVSIKVKFDSTYMKPGPFSPPAVQLLIVARTEDKKRFNLWWADIFAQ